MYDSTIIKYHEWEEIERNIREEYGEFNIKVVARRNRKTNKIYIYALNRKTDMRVTETYNIDGGY